MSYLSRPVYATPINWSDPVQRTWSYDQRELTLGGAAVVFQPTETNVVQGWSFGVEVTTAAVCRSEDDFFDALSGRLKGFWLPTPMEAMQIVSADAGGAFMDIVDQGLAETWNAGVDTHLMVSTATGSAMGSITGVQDLGNGKERVTFLSALTPALLIPTALVNRLHYVRLVEDAINIEVLAEGWQRRSVKVVELPWEYQAAETGLKPVYLYHFWMDAPLATHWRYASFPTAITSGGLVWESEAITHGKRKQSTQGINDTLDISMRLGSDTPLGYFLPIPPSATMRVEVLACDYASLNATSTLFTGQVMAIQQQQDRVVARCGDLSQRWSRKLPCFYMQGDCNYQLYEPNTCQVNRANYGAAGVIVAMDMTALPPTMRVQLPQPTNDVITADYFAGGMLEAGLGTNYELRTLMSSTLYMMTTDTLVLTLAVPVYHLAVGDWVALWAGCDGTIGTCAAKFNNTANFGGFPTIPLFNLSIAESASSGGGTGGKK